MSERELQKQYRGRVRTATQEQAHRRERINPSGVFPDTLKGVMPTVAEIKSDLQQLQRQSGHGELDAGQ